MTDAPHVESAAAARVLELLQVKDLETLRERSKMMSIKQSTDLLVPVVASLAAEDDDGTAQRELQPALGVALYQSLIRKRLAGRSMQAVIEQVMSGEYKKPRELDRSIPRALEAIITRTLRFSPEERFDSMRDLGAALLPFASKPVQQSYVADFGPSIGPGRRGESQSGNPEVEDTKRSRRRGDLMLLAAAIGVFGLFVVAHRRDDEASALARAPDPAQEATRTQEATPAQAAPAREAVPAQEAAPQEVVPAREAAEARAPAQEAPAPTAPSEPARAEARRGSLEVAARAQANTPSVYSVDLTVEPADAWIMLDGKAAGRGRFQRILGRDGKAHELHVGAPGYKVQALRFQDAAPPTAVVLQKRAPRAAAHPAR